MFFAKRHRGHRGVEIKNFIWSRHHGMRSDEHGRIRNPAMRLAHVCGIAPFLTQTSLVST